MCQMTDDKRSQSVPRQSILTQNQVKEVALTDDIVATKNWTHLVNPVLQVNKFAVKVNKVPYYFYFF